MARPGNGGTKGKTFIVRIVRHEREDWQGQLVDVGSGETHPFASFLQFQRLLLTLAGDAAHGFAPVTVASARPAEGLGRGA